MGTARWCLGMGLLLTLSLICAHAQEKDKDSGKKDEKKTAKIVFLVPEKATLSINGKDTARTGVKRTFETPPLKPDVKSYYEATIVFEPNNYTTITRSRKVFVEPGKTVEVDMRNRDPDIPDDIKVRYVPTPDAVVDAMLKLAKVGKDDVVFDLGCGDGRIPIRAVKKYAAKLGVGVDIDPVRIRESKQNAKIADVEEKVDFRVEDVMKIKDLGKATVVTLYLGQALNRQLLPILKKELKPGSRIVSHRFTFGPDWAPEKTEKLKVDGLDIEVHLWTIKAKDEK